jgi:hypothetical protein
MEHRRGASNRRDLNLGAHRATEAIAEISVSASSSFEPTSLRERQTRVIGRPDPISEVKDV